MLVLAGCVPIETGMHVVVTVTVRVNVAPTQAPDVGVTVYVAVPDPEGTVNVPLILD
jgi:hypothetical protein